MKKLLCFLLILIAIVESTLIWAAPTKQVSKSVQNSTKKRKNLHPKKQSRGIFNGWHAWLDFRLRHERVDVAIPNLMDAYGTTLRTRVGFETGELYYLQGLLEIDNVSILGPQHFNSGGGTSPSKTQFATITDPRATEINQAYINFTGVPKTLIRVGRQRINLDNQRFVGGVEFRQNEQTFDGVSGMIKAIKSTKIFYAYVWQVNRIFGPNAIPPFNKFISQSQFININFSKFKGTHIIPYVYLIDDKNAALTSNKTYGLRLTGDLVVHGPLRFIYTAEYAYQTNGFNNPARYSEKYYHLVGGATIKWITGKIGYEVLGGNGTNAFQTPYATLHKFNGWADVFLITPSTGLQDFYGSLEMKLKKLGGIKFITTFHSFHSQINSIHFGNEIDVGIFKRLFKHFGVSVEYANFHSHSALTPNVQKIWLTGTADFST